MKSEVKGCKRTQPKADSFSKGVFYYSAKTQHENLGDTVINRELLGLILPFGELHILCGGMPASFLNAIGADRGITYNSSIRFVCSLVKKAILRLFIHGREPVYLLLNPGGISGGLNFSELPRQIALLTQYVALNILGVRIVRLGASCGPFSKERVRFERLKSFFIFRNTVRDTISLEYAKRISLGRVRYFPDLAFMLEPSHDDINLEAELPRPFILMSFRQEKKLPDYDESLINTLTSVMVQRKDGENENLIFSSQVLFDVAWNGELAQTFKQRRARTLSLGVMNENELMYLYKNAHAVYSNRLHVLLFAMRQGTPVYPVINPEHNTKITGIFNDLGFSELIIDIREPQTRLPNVPANYRQRVSDLFALRQKEAQSHLWDLLEDRG